MHSTQWYWVYTLLSGDFLNSGLVQGMCRHACTKTTISPWPHNQLEIVQTAGHLTLCAGPSASMFSCRFKDVTEVHDSFKMPFWFFLFSLKIGYPLALAGLALIMGMGLGGHLKPKFSMFCELSQKYKPCFKKVIYISWSILSEKIKNGFTILVGKVVYELLI